MRYAMAVWMVCWASVLWPQSFSRAEDPIISVTGEAEIKVTPDLARLNFGIEARAKTVTQAGEEVEKKQVAVVEFLKSSGIDSVHIRSQVISIEPIYAQESRVRGKGEAIQANQDNNPFGDSQQPIPLAITPAGYKVGRAFVVTIVELKKFETIYKGIVERGINRIDGIEFSKSDLNAIRKQLRLQAVADARDKAQAMAKVLGASLASIKSMRETTSRPFSSMRASRAGGMGDPFGDSGSTDALHAGEMVIEATVDVVFELGDNELAR